MRRDLIDIHRGVPPGARRRPGGRLRSRDVRHHQQLLPHRGRIAGGQSAGAGVRAPPAQHLRHVHALPRRPGRRAALGGARHRCVRRVPRAQRPARIRHARRRRRSDLRALLGRALPSRRAARPGLVPGADPLSAGGPLVQPAGGLPVSAHGRRLRTFMVPNDHPDLAVRLHQLEATDQARVRLHLLPARQALPGGHAVPLGRREDGGDHPEGGGGHARLPLLSRHLRAWPARTTSTRRPRCRPTTVSSPSPWALAGPWWTESACRPSVPATPAMSCSAATVEDVLQSSQRDFWALDLGASASGTDP